MADRRGAAVTCRQLSKTYDTRGAPVSALAPLDLEVEAGQTVALVGPSGCGKSTLLRLLAGLETPTAGSAVIGDESPAQLAARGGLSMAFQDAALLPWRSVSGNVALALKLARRPRDPAAIQSLIDLVGLGGFEDRRPAELSGGMRQRAAIARCLISEPELLLLDEPFGSVDELTRGQLNLDLPALWRARGATALMVTHSVREAVLIADRVLVLSPRPARLIADIDTRFDVPRDAALTMTDPFLSKVGAVTDALTQGVQ